MNKILKIIILILAVLAIVSFIFSTIYSKILVSQLFNAIDNQNVAKVKIIIEKGVNLNTYKYSKFLATITENPNPTPLIQACKIGNQDIIELLIKNGADINKKSNISLNTPLMSALTNTKPNRYELAFILINHGADINVCTVTSTPIDEAISTSPYDEPETFRKGYELFLYLINDKNYTIKSPSSETMLTLAAMYNNTSVIEYLLNNNIATVDETNKFGQSALSIAANHNSLQACELLLKYNSDKYVVDEFGKTALDYAKEIDNEKIIELLSK